MKAVPARMFSSSIISVMWSRKEDKIVMKFGKLVYLLSYAEARKLAELIVIGGGDLDNFHVEENKGKITIKVDGYRFTTDYKDALVYAIHSEIGEACHFYPSDKEEGTA